MSVSYTTINGEIVSENRNGVPSDYIPDALGSTIALLSDTHQITDSWTYWPNGQVRTHTGSSTTPFTFCGTLGYHSDLVGNFTYVRARQLRTGLAKWQTLDQLWPRGLSYSYVKCAPNTYVDPSGLQSVPPSCPGCTTSYNNYVVSVCFSCQSSPTPGCQQTCNAAASAYYYACLNSNSSSHPKQSPPWGSFPPGDWTPIHGIGVVPPIGVPIPPTGSQIGAPPWWITHRCNKTPDDCVKKGSGGGRRDFFELNDCLKCAAAWNCPDDGCYSSAGIHTSPWFNNNS